jgi:hypothetical protein
MSHSRVHQGHKFEEQMRFEFPQIKHPQLQEFFKWETEYGVDYRKFLENYTAYDYKVYFEFIYELACKLNKTTRILDIAQEHRESKLPLNREKRAIEDRLDFELRERIPSGLLRIQDRLNNWRKTIKVREVQLAKLSSEREENLLKSQNNSHYQFIR